MGNINNGTSSDAPAFGGGCGSFKSACSFGQPSPFQWQKRRHGPLFYLGIEKLLNGIRSVLDQEQMPANTPREYRAALLMLLEARVDRTDGRGARFDRAIMMLRHALDIAAHDSELFSRMRSLKIDQRITTWKGLCHGGPYPLPRVQDQVHQKYEYEYVAEGGEFVAEVAATIGLERPEALTHAAYGYNLHMRLRKGDRVFVPFPKARLKIVIEQFEKAIEGANAAFEEAEKTLEEQHEQLEHTLLWIEAAGILLNLANGLRMGIKETGHAAEWVLSRVAPSAVRARHAMEISEHAYDWAKVMLQAKRAHTAAEAAKEIVIWGRDLVSHTALEVLGLAWGTADKGIRAARPTLTRVLNLLGVLSPGWWSPVLGFAWNKIVAKFRTDPSAVARDEAAAKEWADLFWHDDARRKPIEDAAKSAISKLQLEIALVRDQIEGAKFIYPDEPR